MQPVPKLITRDLTKTFRRGDAATVALDRINISVNDGEFISIVGASGCGKTTLLRLIDGLIDASSGSVLLDDKPVDKRAGDIAFVFQQDGLLPWRSVNRNTVFGPELLHRDMTAAKKTASAFLRLVGLGGFRDHYPHELSGGMRQRVNLARALTVGANVLLMDEPFAALDAQTREIMQAELMRVWNETRKTVLLVTHQIDEAVYLSDRVLVFTARPGRLKEEVKIDLPRPRELSVKRTPEFVRYTDRIWRLIEEEVRDSIGRETAALA
jgi:ABC-type nitrate/sulfonate/bicarbonate transport system ATPase subunit